MRIDFEGRAVEARPGDTIASALFRSGVRVFSRSFKLHRRRGLYCLTGDCPNCLMTVAGEPGVRTCMTPASAGVEVRRERGWPSPERDVLGILSHLGWLFPVGFYYKVLARPRWAWPQAERLVRALTGVGAVDPSATPRERESINDHPDVLIVGAGVAGLAAALEAAGSGRTAVVVDEGVPGETIAPGSTRSRLEALLADVRRADGVRLFERAAAIGVYEGPLVPVVTETLVHLVRPGQVVVATGAVEQHAVFEGSDLPGVWLARGASRLAGVHGLAPARRAVVAGATPELGDHVRVLRDAGVEIVAVAAPHGLELDLPDAGVVHPGASVLAARGRTGIAGVRLRSEAGERLIPCDGLILSTGLVPRDSLLRQGAGLAMTAAGDVTSPGCSLAEAEASGRRAVRGEYAASPSPGAQATGVASGGVVCLCEDVKARDLERAWSEGFRSTELLKRYTTATMGPCQGALCGPHLEAFARSKGAAGPASAATTARPPARPVRLEDAAAGVHLDVEHRTALHQRHLDLGAAMEWLGAWRRPEHYGDVLDEYWAVRRRVSIMDVGTLGKFLIGGPEATEFLERIYPCRVGDLEPGRLRYTLMLNEAGFVLDDGLICALPGGRFYCTLSSGGADVGEAWLRQWREFFDLKVNVLNRTAALGAINVAGPAARELLSGLADETIDAESFPHLRHRELDVAGVRCHVLRLGFVGELSYELHHAASESVCLWDALLGAGAELGIKPCGVEALRLLRLEKGHILVGQDTDFDSTPDAIGLGWTVRLDKDTFIGKRELERLSAIPTTRRLVGLTFDGESAPPEGAPLSVEGRHVGYLTSSRFSPVLGYGIGLGWLDSVGGRYPTAVRAADRAGTVTTGAFYDPEGVRLRA
ncbi:MAG: 2Fe-2S iron-sulfur cluster-binding protein [Actinomycetia bacterium]|nr:2Fe-2S iron-sulfur cluster-binding protein [Actinomycetes bacterium]